MAQVAGMRTTYHNSSSVDNNIVRNVASEMLYLYPDIGPLITLLSNLSGGKESVDSPVLEWQEFDTDARWAQMSTTTVAAATASTSVIVTDGTLFTAGDLVEVPKAVNVSTAPEVFRVVSISTNTLTVVRAIGGASTVDTIPANAALRLIGTAYEEGGAAPDMKSTSPTWVTTYTQIHKTAIELSNTAQAVKIYGTNNQLTKLQKDKLRVHKEGLNAALYFGAPSRSLTAGPTGKPIATTQSLSSRISTNIFDANGSISFRGFQEFARSVFEYVPTKKMLLMAPPILQEAIDYWGFTRLQVRPGDKKLGVSFKEVETSHGTFMVVKDWQLKNGVSGQNGHAGTAFAVYPPAVKYCYLKGRDTSLLKDIKMDGYDRRFDCYLTEYAWKIEQEQYHGKMYNITGYQG